MFNSLISTLVSGISKAIDSLLTWILNLATFDLSFFADEFPIVGTMYTILQAVGVVLVVVIAGFQIYKFFFGPLSDAAGNPLEIAVRTVVAVFLIFAGNYVLEMVVNLFSYPYKKLLEIDAWNSVDGSTVMQGITSTITSGGLTAIAGLLIALVVIIALGWNVIKLGVEVVERFMMIGVLTYTSPLAWSTVTSRATHSIFTKWISMFLGQCLLMILNVWSVKMLVNVLSNDAGGNTLFRCVVALAFCKVAQRFDTYLQTLGINAAHTGGSMLDDIVAAGSTLKSIGKSTVGNGIMGTDSGLGKAVQSGGALGGLGYIAGQKIGNKSNSGVESVKETVTNAPTNAYEAAMAHDYNQAQEEGRSWSPDDFAAKYKDAKEQFIADDMARASKNGDEWSYADAEGRWNAHQAEMYAQQQGAKLNNQQGANRQEVQSGSAKPEYESWKSNRNDMINGGFNMKNFGTAFNDDGTAKDNASYIANNGHEVLSGSSNADVANKIANSSTPAAMAGMVGSASENASVVKANTVATRGAGTARELINSSVDGGVQDSRVNAATYEALFSGDNTTIDGMRGGANSNEFYGDASHSIDTVIPGLSDAVSASIGEPIEGSGEVSNMSMYNGEMSGTFQPAADASGISAPEQEFSIRTSESYHSLPQSQRQDYTTFSGADGNTYYAKTTEVSSSSIESGSGTSRISGGTPSISGGNSGGGYSGGSGGSYSGGSQNISAPASSPALETNNHTQTETISIGSGSSGGSAEVMSGAASTGYMNSESDIPSISVPESSSPAMSEHGVDNQEIPSGNRNANNNMNDAIKAPPISRGNQQEAIGDGQRQVQTQSQNRGIERAGINNSVPLEQNGGRKQNIVTPQRNGKENNIPTISISPNSHNTTKDSGIVPHGISSGNTHKNNKGNKRK